MENLFLSAMTTDEIEALDNIKKNKAFMMRLIDDLSKVYRTNHSILDSANNCTIYIKTSSQDPLNTNLKFVVTKNGVFFHAKVLGYRNKLKDTDNRSFGELYERYKDAGTTATNGFLSNSVAPFGTVNFILPIFEGDAQVLRDIMYIMEHESFRKRF